MSAFTEIQLNAVRKIFGRHPALTGVSFTLTQGRISLLMGPNGAGKSTLLWILSTLSRPTSGQVRYGEHDHDHASRHFRGRIGLVAHSAMLYSQMSSRENLRFFARMYGIHEPDAIVEKWLHQVRMEDAADRPVGQLSRGMAQRVALARALLPDPDFLLLDEPFTGLDREAVQLLQAELERTLSRRKIILLVTHDVEAVDRLCGHLLVLKRGGVASEVTEPALSSARILDLYHGT